MQNKNNQLLVISLFMSLVATSCLKTESEDPAQQQPAPEVDVVVDHRLVLVESLNKQAVSFVTGINEVFIKGDFLKNMSLENPPEPIPLDDNNEVNKAINYILAAPAKQNGAWTYKPDARVCSEIFAKNDPNTCIEMMKNVSLIQYPADKSSGVVDIFVSQSKLLRLTYSTETVFVQLEASSVVSALREVSKIEVQLGGQGFEDHLPLIHLGEAAIKLTSAFGVSAISLDVTKEIKLMGKTREQKDYSLEIGQRENVASISLSPATSMGIVQLDMPAIKITAPIYDKNDNSFELKVDFPGVFAALSLENALSRISLAGLKMAQDTAHATIDGQLAVQLFSNTKLDGYIQSQPGRQITLKSDKLFFAQADVYKNNMFDDNGQISLSIDAATEVLVDQNKKQAEFISGALNIIGTGSFDGQINFATGDCAGEDQQSNDIISKVVCQ